MGNRVVVALRKAQGVDYRAESCSSTAKAGISSNPSHKAEASFHGSTVTGGRKVDRKAWAVRSIVTLS